MRDRYGVTQVVFNNESNAALCEAANHLGREYVIQVTGEVAERSSKNANLPTGDIEIIATDLKIQIIDKEGNPLSNCEIEIGYTGLTLSTTVNETGIINQLFTLSKGEYIIILSSTDSYAKFYINESTEDESLIVVQLN
jgi:uncharacterized GH25 family protein